jgi:arylsulfatase A-like enzyme
LGGLRSLEELMPTFCQLGGLKTPETCVGPSLLKPARKHVVSELLYGDASREGRMLRSAGYKYVVFNSGRNREQLFDLRKDPGEMHNLAASENRVLRDHRTMLKNWMKHTSDNFAL